MAVGPVPPVDFRQRRGSLATRPRVLSTSSARPSQISPSGSPRKQETVLPPRPRMNSIITRGLDGASSAPSPLAQIYQSFSFETDRDPGAEGESTARGFNVNGFVPRRRLTSIQRRETRDPNDPGQSGNQRFPALSESPDDGSNRAGPESVSEVEESGGGMGLLEKRFDRMEERQKRIEEMLTHLTSSLRR